MGNQYNSPYGMGITPSASNPYGSPYGMGITPTASNPYGSPYSMGISPLLNAAYSGGSLSGASAANYSPTAGGIPSVPNPNATAGQAISGNLGNFGDISKLGLDTAKLNAQIGATPYNQNLPNYQGLLGQASSNAQSQLAGQLPADVLNQISRVAAERGVTTGSPNSPNANAAALRALGLNSLQMQQQGMANFGQLVGLTPTGPVFNPASMYVNPETMQQAQAAANLYNAAPIPQYAQNAAMNALQRGIGQGQRATGPGGVPSQNQDLVGSIISRYAPTVGAGTPAMPSSPVGGGYGDFNPETGEYPVSTSSRSDYSYGVSEPDFGSVSTTDASSPDYWDFGNLYDTGYDSSYDEGEW